MPCLCNDNDDDERHHQDPGDGPPHGVWGCLARTHKWSSLLTVQTPCPSTRRPSIVCHTSQRITHISPMQQHRLLRNLAASNCVGLRAASQQDSADFVFLRNAQREGWASTRSPCRIAHSVRCPPCDLYAQAGQTGLVPVISATTPRSTALGSSSVANTPMP